MSTPQLLDTINTIQKQLHVAQEQANLLLVNRSMQELASIKSIVATYMNEHNVLQSDIAMLAGISANTMTRLLKDPESAKVSTLSSVLDVLGLSLFIGSSNA